MKKTRAPHPDIRVQPVSRASIERLVLRNEVFASLDADLAATIEAGTAKYPGLVFEAWFGRTLLGAAGVSVLEPWLGLAWLMPNGPVPRFVWPTVTLWAARVLDRAHDCGVRRIEAFVLPRHREGRIWAQKLGFAFEATCYGRGPEGETLDRYVRLDVSADWRRPRRVDPRSASHGPEAWPFREHRSMADIAELP